MTPRTAEAELYRPLAVLAYDRGVGRAIASLPGLVAEGKTTRETFIAAVSRQLAGTGEPVLTAELISASLRAADAVRELLGRFAEDRAAIIAGLLGARDPGPITAIEPGLGHPHQGGRSVTRLSFADGRRLIYRPRSVAAPQWFGDALDWLNQRVPQGRLRHAVMLPRPGYGWAECVEHQPPVGLAGLDRFYRSCGMLLAVLYAVDAVGLDPGNFMASADGPVPVNVEAIFHPSRTKPADAADPAAVLLAASVYRTGLLQAISAPGRRTDGWETGGPADAETAVLAGFRLGYDAIAAQRDGFARLVRSARDLDVRFIPRPAGEYRRLLAVSAALGGRAAGGDREAALTAALVTPADRPQWRRLVPHELADLRAGDFPLLTSRPADCDVRTSAGVQLSEVLGRPGMDRVLAKVTRLNEVDRRDQEWIISATLAARRPRTALGTAAPLPLTSIAASPDRLVAVACGLADEIVSRSIASESLPPPGRVNWLGVGVRARVGVEVRPLGGDLANGYLGVALYLAQLASLTGVGRYAEIARQALNAAPSLLRTLSARPDLLAAAGCGGYDGLSGISYGLARLATLLGDPQLGEWAVTAVGLTAVAARPAARPGWADGAAGCLAAMMAVGSEIGSPDAESLARTTAGRLAELVEQTNGRCAPDAELPAGGFARGPAGVGWALARFAAATGEQAYLRAGTRAVRRAVSLAEAAPAAGDGWCRGTAGLLLARCCLTDPASRARLGADVLTLSSRPVRRDLSLCAGELGITEALIAVSATGRVAGSPEPLRRRAGLLLDALRRNARYCGTPGGVSTPGLLHGLAGIGYGLLRLGFPDRVPAVLLLEPSPPGRPTELADSPADQYQRREKAR